MPATTLSSARQRFGEAKQSPVEDSKVRAAAEELRKRNAERYYHRGVNARRMEMWQEAVACFEGAVRIDATNAEYTEALADAQDHLKAVDTIKAKRAETTETTGILAGLRDQITVDKRLLGVAVGVVIVGLVLSIWRMLPEPTPPTPAEITLIEELGIFASLEEVEGVGWRATINESLSDDPRKATDARWGGEADDAAQAPRRGLGRHRAPVRLDALLQRPVGEHRAVLAGRALQERSLSLLGEAAAAVLDDEPEPGLSLGEEDMYAGHRLALLGVLQGLFEEDLHDVGEHLSVPEDLALANVEHDGHGLLAVGLHRLSQLRHGQGLGVGPAAQRGQPNGRGGLCDEDADDLRTLLHEQGAMVGQHHRREIAGDDESVASARQHVQHQVGVGPQDLARAEDPSAVPRAAADGEMADDAGEPGEHVPNALRTPGSDDLPEGEVRNGDFGGFHEP